METKTLEYADLDSYDQKRVDDIKWRAEVECSAIREIALLDIQNGFSVDRMTAEAMYGDSDA